MILHFLVCVAHTAAHAWEGSVDANPIATLLGGDADEHLRGPVRSADLDGDGWPELLLGSPQGPDLGYATGKVYLVSGPAQGALDLNLATTLLGADEHDTLGVDLAPGPGGLWVGADRSGLTSRDVGLALLWRAPAELVGRTVLGEADLVVSGDDPADALGRALARGDFDGDGLDELALAAPIRDGEGAERRGAVWWLPGDGAGATGAVPVGQLATSSWVGPEARAWLGWRLEAPGDLDGDGREDLVVGALGEGATFGGRLWVVTSPGEPADRAWDCGVAGARAGEGLDGGDLDGDGVAELLVGAPLVDRGDGRVWLLSGAPEGVEDLDAAALAVLGGEPGAGLGAAVSLGPALLVGAIEAGEVWVLDEGLTRRGRLRGPASTGASLAWAGDHDGDGQPDALVLAPDHGLTRERQGVGWLVSGALLLDEGPGLAPDDDADGDGTPSDLDCDDADPRRGDGPERCGDDVDNDCDWEVDERDCSRGSCSTSPRAGGLALALALLAARRRWPLAAVALAGCAGPDLSLEVPPGPLSGEVQLSLTGNHDQLAIEIDGVALGGGPGPALTLDWDTREVADGLVTVRGLGFSGRKDPVEVEQQVEVFQGADDLTPPVLGFLHPLGGDRLPVGEELLIEVDAVDPGGLARVALSVGGALLGELPVEGPFEWAWTPAAEGPVTLTAEAEDLAGNVSTAGVVVEVVGASGMECVLSAPREGEAVSGVVSLRAAISAEDGVASATFTADGEPVAEDGASPWEATWDSAGFEGRSVTLAVEGRSRGGDTCSDAVVVEVSGEATALEVRITQPSDGAEVFGAAMPVRVAAGGGAGVQGVRLVVGGEDAGEDVEAPYAFTVDTTAFPDGPLSIEAVATEAGTGAEVGHLIEVEVANGR